MCEGVKWEKRVVRGLKRAKCKHTGIGAKEIPLKGKGRKCWLKHMESEEEDTKFWRYVVCMVHTRVYFLRTKGERSPSVKGENNGKTVRQLWPFHGSITSTFFQVILKNCVLFNAFLS